MSNKSEGTAFENELAEILADNGFWAHLLTQSREGQPADIIAIKNNRPYLIDCKDCKRDRFVLSRIEYNQELAMTLYHRLGNSFALFALKLSDGTVYIVPFADLITLRQHRASIGIAEMEKYGKRLDDWLQEGKYYAL